MTCGANILIILIILLIVFGILWLMQQKPKELYYNSSNPSYAYAQLNTAYNPYLYSPSLQNKCGYVVAAPVDECNDLTPSINHCLQGQGQRPCMTKSCGSRGLQGRPIVFDYSNITDFTCSKREPSNIYNDKVQCDAPSQTVLCSL
jgi:hypothetical protein